MKKYLSDVRYEVINAMTVISGTAIGNEPEDEIIDRMGRLSAKYNVKALRTFGFDSPVECTEDVTQLRGYEYWLAIDSADVAKFPNINEFEFEGTVMFIKQIPAYRYATLRIEDPMVDPFERIGGGWQFLAGWLEQHDFKSDDFQHCEKANCLEEVKTVEGIMVMDIYVPIDRA